MPQVVVRALSALSACLSARVAQGCGVAHGRGVASPLGRRHGRRPVRALVAGALTSSQASNGGDGSRA